MAESRDVAPSGPRVLVVSAMLPTPRHPVRGIVVQREVERLRRAGIPVRAVGKEPGWRGYLRQAREVRRSLGWAQVVHAHYGTSGFVAAALGARPLVITMHGSDIAHGLRPSRSKYWPQFLLSLAGSLRAQTVVLQDASMGSTLPQRIRDRCVVLGQPVDLPREPLPEHRCGVLFLSARDRPVKRFALAEQAAALVGVELDSLDRHPVDAVPAAMRAARVGLLTSEREGLPVAVKEALACGLRVVSVRLPALEPLADEVGDALLLTGHDPAEVADGLRTALALPPLDEARRDHLHAVLTEHGWSAESHTAALRAMYTRLVRPPEHAAGVRPAGQGAA